MILKTKDFKEAANKILLANDSDKNINCLELVVKKNNLYLNVTNREFYVSVKFPLGQPAEFHAVINADLFLKIVASLSSEEFELAIVDNYVLIKTGTLEYKFPMIYQNETLMELPVITLNNKTVEMSIKLDDLQSILNVNSKELLKAKNIDVNELQKLYYIDDNGCFTFTTGACLNSFKLEKPVKMLLNDRIVKLFRLFKTDVSFELAQDTREDNSIATKISMTTPDVYLAAYITNDEKLIDRIQGPCNAAKNYIAEHYDYSIVLSVKELSAAIGRLMIFTKQNNTTGNNSFLPIDAVINNQRIKLSDKFGNTESVKIENTTGFTSDYEFSANMFDLKLVLDSCKVDTITFNCGNHRSIIITRGPVTNLIPEIAR